MLLLAGFATILYHLAPGDDDGDVNGDGDGDGDGEVLHQLTPGALL